MVLNEQQKNFFLFFLAPIFFLIKKNSPKLPNNGHFCKNCIQGVFSWFFRNCTYQSAEFFLCCISCIKMLLLSHQNQLLETKFKFCSPKEKVAMTAWSTRNEAKACNTVGGTSFRGSLDKSRMVSRTKNIKMFHQYLPENTLENKF